MATAGYLPRAKSSVLIRRFRTMVLEEVPVSASPRTDSERPAPPPATVERAGPEVVAGNGRHRALAAILVGLALAIATTSISGPIGLDLIRYRTSDTTLNQLMGGDAAALCVVVPLALAAAVLAYRRHPAAPPLATGIGVYALYTYTQVIVGQEYLRLPGNVEDFFPLLLTVFLLGEALVVLAWRATPAELPPLSRRLRRTTAVILLLVAVFLVFGQHLRSLLTAWADPASLTEYASSPTPFWLVKLMDLGIVVPAASASGIGLLRRAGWALRVALPLLTAYACLGASVAAMAVVMYVNGDPDASLGILIGFVFFALAFAALAVALYRPLFSTHHER